MSGWSDWADRVMAGIRKRDKRIRELQVERDSFERQVDAMTERLQAHQTQKTYANCPRCHIVLEMDQARGGTCPNCLRGVVVRKMSGGYGYE